MDSELLDMLNDQMNFEYESAYLYKAMSAYFADMDLDGFTNRMDIQVKEEIDHGEGMKNFLQQLNYKVKYEAIPKPRDEFKDILDVMKSALEHEKVVSSRIQKIANKAKELDNDRVYHFLQRYVNEQVEEEDNFTKLIRRLERVGNDRPSIYMIDDDLATRTYTPASILGNSSAK